MNPIFILVAAQLLFSTSDLMARMFMIRYGFTSVAFLSPWFFMYFFIRILAMFGQLYVFTQIELGKTAALFGAVSIVLANILGLLVLKEVFSPIIYVGIFLATAAFIVLAFR